ncbi:MAG TPA: hypothetical protein VN132_11815, partial [Bdellovibrio sp.]|nr:hypothetical protein [Bdellovibrio sp.]
MIKHDAIRLLATQKISAALQKMNQTLNEDEIYKALVEPPQSEMGDLAFGCFILAKALKKAPPQVSQEIAQNIGLDAQLVKAQGAGPYLNLTFSPEVFGENVLVPILDGSFFKKQTLDKSPKTMIEY